MNRQPTITQAFAWVHKDVVSARYQAPCEDPCTRPEELGEDACHVNHRMSERGVRQWCMCMHCHKIWANHYHGGDEDCEMSTQDELCRSCWMKNAAVWYGFLGLIALVCAECHYGWLL